MFSLYFLCFSGPTSKVSNRDFAKPLQGSWEPPGSGINASTWSYNFVLTHGPWVFTGRSQSPGPWWVDWWSWRDKSFGILCLTCLQLQASSGLETRLLHFLSPYHLLQSPYTFSTNSNAHLAKTDIFKGATFFTNFNQFWQCSQHNVSGKQLNDRE